MPGDRNSLIDPQNVFLEIKCQIGQAFEADLKYNFGAEADVNKTDAHFFCNNILNTRFSDCTVSASGFKISNANGKLCLSSFFGNEFSHNKDAKATWLYSNS